MEIATITKLTQATFACGETRPDCLIKHGFASDLMSDVLTMDSDGLILVTGLCNLQTIRTAEMAEIMCILFVRGKEASPEMIALAEDCGMILLKTDYSMFRTVGILYSNGLAPLF